MRNILITGGAGFVGSSLALALKDTDPTCRIVCFDNLRRRGSELNVLRLREHKIAFHHGDVRSAEDLEGVGDVDLLIECSAEPSVMAGHRSPPMYVTNTNISGTINCLELARNRNADVVFLSTSRVYPYGMINSLNFHEQETRFVLDKDQSTPGVSRDGITEHLPLDGPRTLYGATKLASEIVIQEYIAMYGLRVIINRCSVITGSWQFGKIDQGVVSFWLASHLWRKDLSFIGYGGKGKQVRDILHVDDLFDLLQIQISEIDRHNGVIYNVGGGENLSISLLELTKLVKEITGNTLEIGSVSADRPGDIRVFVTDTKKVFGATGWKPKRTIETILYEMCNWLIENETSVKSLL